jgi:hypothetical protein
MPSSLHPLEGGFYLVQEAPRQHLLEMERKVNPDCWWGCPPWEGWDYHLREKSITFQTNIQRRKK